MSLPKGMQTHLTDYSSQEHKILGSTEFEEGRVLGNPYLPIGLIKLVKQSLPITSEEIAAINERRTLQRVFSSPLLGLVAGNSNAFFRLSPLDEHGNTLSDPAIVRQVGDSFVADSQLTEKFYSVLRSDEQEGKGKGKDAWEYSYYLRDGSSKQELINPGNKERL